MVVEHGDGAGSAMFGGGGFACGFGAGVGCLDVGFGVAAAIEGEAAARDELLVFGVAAPVFLQAEGELQPLLIGGECFRGKGGHGLAGGLQLAGSELFGFVGGGRCDDGGGEWRAADCRRLQAMAACNSRRASRAMAASSVSPWIFATSWVATLEMSGSSVRRVSASTSSSDGAMVTR